MSDDMIGRVTEVIFLMLPTSCSRKYARAIALNVIEAMREPTDEMVSAANALDEVSKGVLITPIPERAWEAMIDAALGNSITEVVPDAQKTL